MIKLKDFGSSKRRVDILRTEVLPNSPLADKYEYILWSIISHRSDKYRCIKPACDQQSWMAVQSNILRLVERDTGNEVNLNELPDEIKLLIDSVRRKIIALCQKHTIEKYADVLIEDEEK